MTTKGEEEEDNFRINVQQQKKWVGEKMASNIAYNFFCLENKNFF